MKASRVALNYLNNVYEAASADSKALLKLLKEAFMKKLNKEEFVTYLQENGIDWDKLAKLCIDIFRTGSEMDIVLVGKMLGEFSTVSESYKVLPKSWLSRQFDWADLVETLPEKWWPLFKDPAWVEKNKKQKYIDIK